MTHKHADQDLRGYEPASHCHVVDCGNSADWNVATACGDTLGYGTYLCSEHRDSSPGTCLTLRSGKTITI